MSTFNHLLPQKIGELIKRRAYLQLLLGKGDVVDRRFIREGGISRAFTVFRKQYTFSLFTPAQNIEIIPSLFNYFSSKIISTL